MQYEHAVFWSPKAKISYYNILEYIQTNWTYIELEAFVSRTKEVLKIISQSPALYPYSKQSDTYRCVLSHQTTLFYRRRNNQIELLVFWDTRRNPSTISY